MAASSAQSETISGNNQYGTSFASDDSAPTFLELGKKERNSSLLPLPETAETAYQEATQLGEDFSRPEFKKLDSDKLSRFFLAPHKNLPAHPRLSDYSGGETPESARQTASENKNKKSPGQKVTSKTKAKKTQQEKSAAAVATSILEELGVPETTSEQLTSGKKQEARDLKLETSEPFGFLEKLALVAMSGVVGFAFITIIGGYLTLFDTTIFQQLLKGNVHQFEFVGKLKARQIYNNSNRQPLYVVEGSIRNLFGESGQIKKIRLKALAFDSEQELLAGHITYAGVVLTDEELSALSTSEIKALRQSGGLSELNSSASGDLISLSLNRIFQEDQEIPFQIVFFEIASSVKRTSVQVVSYMRQDKPVYVRIPDDF